MALTRPRASQIYNLDYKQATRVVTTANINLTSGAPRQVDSVTLAINDRILVTGQAIASQNGLYLVATVGSGSNGVWTRTSDGNETGEIEAGMIVMVTEGVIYADTQWKLITDNPIVIGTTALTFTQNYMANSIAGGSSNVTVFSNANVVISSAGTANVLTISSTGIVVTGTESVSGNVTGGNILTGGLVSATGNINGNYLNANIYYATGFSASRIFSGTSEANIGTAGGNANISIGGTANVAVFATTGEYVTGVVSATGNITGGNILTGGLSISGNVIGNILPAANITYDLGSNTQRWRDLWLSNSTIYLGNAQISANATAIVMTNPAGGQTVLAGASGASSITGAIVSASGNITGGNVLTGGLISATGNVSGNFFIGNGSALTGVVATGVGTLTTLSVTGNTTTGNLLTGGLVSATGTVTGSSFSGAGTGLTGTAASLTVGSATTAGTAGSATTAGTVTTAAQPNITSVGTLSSLTVSGNTTSGNLLTAGLVSATGNLYTSNAVTYSNTSNILGWWSSNSVSVATQENNSTDVQFNATGNIMYIVGTSTRTVYQYGLSTPWQVATATYASLSSNVAAQAASPQSINFNSSGNTMFVLDQTTRAVYQYSISNTANIATATYASLSANISAQETTTPAGMTFSPDGANMYIVGTTLDTIYQYSISNTANIATATYASKSLSITTQESTASGLAFNATGSVLYLIGTSARVVYQYNLGTPYDISTGSYTGNNLYVGYQDSSPTGIYVNLANSAVYIVGSANDRVSQYDTGNSTIINSNSLAVTGYAHFSGNAQMANVYLPYNATLSVAGSVTTGTATFNAGITAGTTTSTINFGTSLTTGAFTIGGTAQTSNINIGRSANTSAIVIGNGATLSANVKTIEIASQGLANSTSNVTIFSNVAGNSTMTIGANVGNTTVSYTGNTIVAIANTSGSALSVAGNVTGGNILTGGLVSATANITGGNLLTAGLVSATGTITGSSHLGSVVSVTANVTGGNILTGGLVSATGTVTGSTLIGSVITATGNITGSYILGNGSQLTGLSATYGNSNVVTLLASFGSNSISTTGDITAGNVNSTNADLAEMYVADADYPAGVVVEFGGDYEITATQVTHSTAVAGIVSTNPSYLMNSTQAGKHVVPVALTGRVPCQVIGPIAKGDRLVSSTIAGVAIALDKKLYEPGCIIGKSLEDYQSTKVGIIEIAVGRF